MNDIVIGLSELEEIVRRMKNSGATHLRVDACVNCDTAEIDELHLDSCDGDLYLDTVFSYYLK